MLLEFAAKQQVVRLSHVFIDLVTGEDRTDLATFAMVAREVDTGAIDGPALRRLLRFEGAQSEAAMLFRSAVPNASARAGGTALALAFLPFEVADAFAARVLAGSDLRRMAAAIDPRSSLAPRTRLFVADAILRTPTAQGLVSAVTAMTVLRANGRHPDFAELADPVAKARRERLARMAEGFSERPALLAEALRSCTAGDWRSAEALSRHAAPAKPLSGPPALADLLILSLLPTCDTIDAARRLMAVVETQV